MRSPSPRSSTRSSASCTSSRKSPARCISTCSRLRRWRSLWRTSRSRRRRRWTSSLPAEVHGKGCQVEYLIRKGVPFLEIIRCADEIQADMIVCGTHGRTGLKHALFGSVAEKVVRKAALPGPERPAPRAQVRDARRRRLEPQSMMRIDDSNLKTKVSAFPDNARRLPDEGRARRRPLRRQGQVPPQPRRQLLPGVARRHAPQGPRHGAADRRRRVHRGGVGGGRAPDGGAPDQGHAARSTTRTCATASSTRTSKSRAPRTSPACRHARSATTRTASSTARSPRRARLRQAVRTPPARLPFPLDQL